MGCLLSKSNRFEAKQNDLRQLQNDRNMVIAEDVAYNDIELNSNGVSAFSRRDAPARSENGFISQGQQATKPLR